MMRTASFTLLMMFLGVQAHAQTTMELRAEADAAFGEADAELNARYKALMGTLAEDEKAALKEAQRAWITYRDASADSEAEVYSGGTLAPVLAVHAAAALTSEQARLLQQLEEDRAPFTGGASATTADAELNEVYQALKSIGGPDEATRTAQRAWLKYRDAFVKATEKIRGTTRAKEMLASLTVLRTERLKMLFPEGYPGDADGGE